MPSVFFLMEDGVPDPMKTVRVKDETKELQDILEHNHNLLPGEQIDPVQPVPLAAGQEGDARSRSIWRG